MKNQNLKVNRVYFGQFSWWLGVFSALLIYQSARSADAVMSLLKARIALIAAGALAIFCNLPAFATVTELPVRRAAARSMANTFTVFLSSAEHLGHF